MSKRLRREQKRKKPTSQKRRSRNRRNRACVESLEDRLLLTISAALSSNDLTITGDADTDVTELSVDSSGFLQHNLAGVGGFVSSVDLDSSQAGEQKLAGSALTSLSYVDSGFNDTVRIQGSQPFNLTAATSLGIQANSILVASTTSISTTGSVTLTAAAENAVASTLSANVDVQGNITAGALQISVETRGTLSTGSLSDATATNSVTETATAQITGATLTVDSMSLSAKTASSYTATATSAQNQITGDVKAFLSNSKIIAAGNVNISAEDTSTLTAITPQRSLDVEVTFPSSVDVTAARNSLNRNVAAYATSGSSITATSGSVNIHAERAAKLSAKAETVSLTSGLPVVIPNSTNFGGTYASNSLLGTTKAYVDSNSSLTTNTSGDISVTALEKSALDSLSGASVTAETSNVSMGAVGTSIGTSIAFNTVGFDVGTSLIAIDALLDTGFATESSAFTEAYILDANVSSAGDLSVAADSETRVNATVSNAVDSAAAGLANATGAAASGILASNMISAGAKAYIDYASTTGTITATGAVDVKAHDSTNLFSNSKIVSASSTTNDGGVSVLDGVLRTLAADHKNTDGTQTVDFGTVVRVANTGDFNSTDGNQSISYGQTVTAANGKTYRYLGVGTSLDLSTADFTDRGFWKETDPGSSLYEYMGGSAVSLDLGTQDYTNEDYWKSIPIDQLVPKGNNVTNSDSVAMGGLVVRNDVRADAIALVDNATVNAASLDLHANENATISAIADSVVSSSGGSAYGTGTSVAIGGIIATNLVQSSSQASLENSTVTTTGNVSLDAADTAEINAVTKSLASSGDTAIGATIAFNTLGYDSQDVLTRSIDALLGTPIATALGTENTSETKAYILDSSVTAGDEVSVIADNRSSLDALISNEASSAASALVNAGGRAVSALLVSNRINSAAQAYIDSSTATNIDVPLPIPSTLQLKIPRRSIPMRR